MAAFALCSLLWARMRVLYPRAICRAGMFFCALLVLASLSGCGLLAKDTDKGAAMADAGTEGEAMWEGEPVPYKVKITVKDGPAYLEGKMKDLSQLISLEKEYPDSMLALERRAIADKETAEKLMRSQCYYDGVAEYSLDDKLKPVVVTLTLIPGSQFTVGHADVIYEPEPVIPEEFLHRVRETGFWGLEKEALPSPQFPKTVPGVETGQPIVADEMLKAVEEIPSNLRLTGYPLAKITQSVYSLDKPKRQLNANITVNTGPPAYMGDIVIHGDKSVSETYLRRLVPWQPGKEPWDGQLVEDYANHLRSLGLFRSVEVKPVKADMASKSGNKKGAIVLPVDVVLAEGYQRSISFSARYDSDTGLGVESQWEHRNIFHSGDKLQLNGMLSQEESGIKAHFEKPAFLDRDNTILADAAALWENTDAYQQQSVKGQLGINRHLARHWWGGLSMFAEGGNLKDNEHDYHAYGVISPRGGLRYDGRNNKLNPSSGTEMELKFEPFSGYYEQSFGAFAGSVSLAGYYAPLGKKPDGKIDDAIVLAARVEGGGMPGASSLRSIPSSLRYYTGGAGSVRGYTYQSIGPRDSEGDPLGGRSYQVVNLESRFMVTENIGIVPFLDGGMVYRDELPQIFGDMDWGVGLGLRYYTPIGPVRLDVATPLHRIDDDPPVQFYISIGQSF